MGTDTWNEHMLLEKMAVRHLLDTGCQKPSTEKKNSILKSLEKAGYRPRVVRTSL